MSEQLEAAFEDALHRTARKFSKQGLSVQAIADAFAGRASVANKYLKNAVEYPRLYSDATTRKRINHT
jgi:hypothetical protein